MTTYLDDQLQERWSDEAHGTAALAAARAEYELRLAADDGGAVARSHVGRAAQRLSEALRLSGEFDDALRFKGVAIDVWVAHDKVRAAFLVRLQRALVLAELGRTIPAHTEMRELRASLDDDAEMAGFYEDFWFQYEARRLVLAGDREGAAQRLEQAASFRRRSRAERIVKWTENALDRLYSAGAH